MNFLATPLMKTALLAILFFLLTCSLAGAQIAINEVMASNSSTIEDEDSQIYQGYNSWQFDMIQLITDEESQNWPNCKVMLI